MKKRVFLVLFSIVSLSAEAQFFAGNDISLISYDFQDEFVNNYRYEELAGSFFTPSVFFQSEKSFFQARFNMKKASADINAGKDFQAESVMEFENYVLEFEYFRKMYALSSSLDAFAGVSHNGHFTYINRVFNSRYFNSESETHEMGALTFSINGMLALHKGRNRAIYKAGIGVLNFGSRPDYESGEIDMRFFRLGEYFRFQNSISGYVTLSERLLLKPEYLLTYYTFENPERMKILKQSFMVGIYLKL